MPQLGKWAIILNLIAAAINIMAGCNAASRLAVSVNFFAAGLCCSTAIWLLLDWIVRKGE